MKTNRDATLHLRVDPQFKAQIEAAAAKLDIPPSSWMRMAIREYIARHNPETLREQAPAYGTQPPPDIPSEHDGADTQKQRRIHRPDRAA